MFLSGQRASRQKLRFAALCYAGVLVCTAGSATAAEGGSGVYVLGFAAPQAGLMPEPGTYFGYNFYAYKGKTSVTSSATRQVPIPHTNHKLPVQVGGTVNVDLDFYAHIFSLTHVFPQKVLGGQPGLSITVPYASADLDVSGNGVLSLTNRFGNVFNIPLSGKGSAGQSGVGDTVLSGLLGWHDGRVHTMAMFNVYAPTGGYDRNRVVNIGKNHWAFEPELAMTYLNEQSGLELSGTAGITFNQKNAATNYKTGNEFHLDVAAIQHLSDTFYLGVAGYAYHQLTGDSGAGASSPLKGRVYGIGPVVGWVIPLGVKQKMFVNARYYQESGAKNRLEGEGFFMTAAIQF